MKLRPYKKPNLPPPGIRWLLFTEDMADWDGPFDTRWVQRSTLEGRPYGIADGVSSPRVFRLVKQRGNVLYMEDGIYRVMLHPESPAIAGWEVAPA